MTAEERGLVRELGSDGLHGHERALLEHVVAHAVPGDPESVLVSFPHSRLIGLTHA